MKRLFKQRLSTHLIHMSKYLKYVFNDFFVIALIFFVGGLGLAYSNFLKTLHAGIWWLIPLIGLVMLISVQLGRLATLTQKPDYVFLLPRDRAMRNYLFQAFKYSGINAAIIQIVVWFILLPLLKIQFKLDWASLICWLLVMLAIKFNWLMSTLISEFQDQTWFTSGWLSKLISPVIIIVIGLLITPWLSLVLMIMRGITLVHNFKNSKAPVNWLRLIQSEDHRMHDIYTVFNMFVDVPNFGSTICRRKYLRPLLKLIPLKRINTYLYLYWHGFVRDKEFSNLYLRLLIIGIIILIFINGSILPVIMGLVFTYLIIFQIIPFYFHFEANAFVHIYPLNGINQLKSFQKMLWSLMIMVELLFMIGLIINGMPIINDLISLVLMTVTVYGMVNLYLPKQIKKNQWKDN